jgi:hypothetical protein
MLRAPKPKLPPSWVAALLVNGASLSDPLHPLPSLSRRMSRAASESLGPNLCLWAVEPFGTKDAREIRQGKK